MLTWHWSLKKDIGYVANWYDKSGKLIVAITDPLPREELVHQLTALGCHPVDIYDELKRVDPDLVLNEQVSEDMNRQFKELLGKGLYPHKYRGFVSKISTKYLPFIF